jgi:hypothetical protein
LYEAFGFLVLVVLAVFNNSKTFQWSPAADDKLNVDKMGEKASGAKSGLSKSDAKASIREVPAVRFPKS